jgi:hypothetical protein
MAYARVVQFENVDSNRMAEIKRDVEQGERPENLPATELIALHNPDDNTAIVIMFFETEDDYRRGDEVMNAMPAGDTPGRRVSVTKHQVAIRATP